MSLCYKCTNSLEQLSYLTNLALILLTLPSSYWPCPHRIDLALILLTFPSSYWPCPHLIDLAFVLLTMPSSYRPCPHLIDHALILLTLPSSYWPFPHLIDHACFYLTDHALILLTLPLSLLTLPASNMLPGSSDLSRRLTPVSPRSPKMRMLTLESVPASDLSAVNTSTWYWCTVG